MKIKLSEKAKKEIEEIQKKIRGDMTDEEWESFKKVRCVCEFYMYQVYEMEHLDRKGKRDWIKRLVESKVEAEKERILKIIEDFDFSDFVEASYDNEECEFTGGAYMDNEEMVKKLKLVILGNQEHSQRKKDEDSSIGNHLGTQLIPGEDSKIDNARDVGANHVDNVKEKEKEVVKDGRK